ncbi:hypothetical protein ANCDUO_20625, partial [Ancylostoma duodenale]
GTMYYYELKSATLHSIGTENIAAEHPTFSPDGGTLVYFQRRADGPHQAVMECVKYQLSMKYLELVNSLACPPYKQFHGVGPLMELVAIDVTNGHVGRLTNHGQCHGSWQVADVCEDEVLAVVSAPNRPPALLLGTLPAKGQEDKMVWTRLDNFTVIENRKNLLNYSWKLVGLQRS